MPTGVVYVGDARLKTHYPHGQMHVVAPHLRIGSAVQRLVLLFRVRSEALGQSNNENPIRLA